MGRNIKDRRDHEGDTTFCEALADGSTIVAAGRAIGVAHAQAHRRFKRICRELGDQAR